MRKIILMCVLLLTGCVNENYSIDVNNRAVQIDLLINNQSSINEILNLDKGNSEVIQNISSKYRITKAKKTSICFELKSNHLNAVNEQKCDSSINYIFDLYRIDGLEKFGEGEMILGVYKWNRYPYIKTNFKMDSLKIVMEFKTPIINSRSNILYSNNNYQSYPLSGFNKGYIWDIDKGEDYLPKEGVFVLESPSKIDGQKVVYEFNSQQADRKNNSDDHMQPYFSVSVN
ncbi:hypothetical protein [Paenibacillus aquistagni]|nr:hypothetical protein [Paenibacillus aquistagni]